jgi:hypothetical protein
MAVVGEAHILVRAVTTHVRKDIRDGFKGLKGQATDQGQDYGKAFSTGLAGEMRNAATAFTSLSRKAYVVQSGLGALLGSASALVGGLGALTGVTLSAASSMGVLANIMVTMKIASAVGKSAFNGISAAVSSAANSAGGAKKSIKELREEMEELAFAAEEAALSQESAALKLEKARETLARVQNLPPDNRARREAELAYKQAELGYRRAKDKAEDAQDEVNNPKKKAGAGGKDPFADLTKSQKVFAKFLVENRYRMKQLREAAAKGFLPVIQQQMDRLLNDGTFEKFVEGVAQVGRALGDATRNFSKAFFTDDSIKNIVELFKQASGNISAFGTILGKVFKGFLFYLSATAPLMNRFTEFLKFKSSNFADNMKKNYSSTMSFFKMAGDNAASFGKIFGNIWLRVKSFIANTTGPGSGGEYLLTWLKEASGNFLKFDQGVRNYASRKYFRDTAETTKVILQTIGGVIRSLTQLGNNPAVKEFWVTLQKGSNNLQKLFQNLVTAGPGLASVLNYIVEALVALSDSAQILAFFSVLETAFRGIANFLTTMKPFFDRVGVIFGYAAAIGFLASKFLLLGKIMGGLLINAFSPLISVFSFAFPAAAAKLGTTMKVLAMTVGLSSKGISASIFAIPFIGWAAAAIAAITALAVVVSNFSTAKAESNMERTMELAKSGASSTDLWASSLQSMSKDGDYIFEGFIRGGTQFGRGLDTTTKSIKGQTQALKIYQEWNQSGWGWLKTTGDSLAYVVGLGGRLFGISNDWGMEIVASQNVAGAYERMGASLKQILEKDGMPGLVVAFRELQKTSKLSNAEMGTAINEMDGLRDALIEQADAMDVNIRTADGLIDTTKLVEFAQGSAAYQTRLAAIEQGELNRVISDAVNSFIDLNGPLNQNVTDMQNWAKATAKSLDGSEEGWRKYFSTTSEENIKKTGFDLTAYLKQLDIQVLDASAYAENLRKVYSRMAGTAKGDAAFKALAGQGKKGAGLVASLVKASQDDLDKVVEGLSAQGNNLGAQVAGAFDMKSVRAAVLKKVGMTNESWAIETMRGLTAPEIMDKFGLQFSDLMASSMAQDPVEVQAKWGTGTIRKLKEDLGKKFNDTPLYITSDKSAKDGGFMEKKNGGWIPKFAGGAIAGAQGPRSDLIPAMLSAGEYVINSASTYRYRPLLDAINSGSIDRLQNTANIQPVSAGNNVSITVNAAPGMDESQVASMVAQKLNSALNMGGRI